MQGVNPIICAQKMTLDNDTEAYLNAFKRTAVASGRLS